jgi:DNA-binding LacI/PurR family transcriptional regulator
MSNQSQQLQEAEAVAQRVVERRPRQKTGPTIRDVARECGVSAMTVSAVLNNRHSKLSAETRERVLARIRSMNYQPSAAARALSRKRTDTIGVVFGIVGAATAMANPYTSGILQGILAEAAKFALDVNLVNRHWHSAEFSAASFKDERTDGLLLIAPSRDSDIVKGLAALERPLITVSGDAKLYGVPSVDTDDDKTGKYVVEHLTSLGHRRIAHITGNDDLTSTQRRLASFTAAMRAHGLQVPSDYVIHAAYSGEGARDAVAQLLGLQEPPTAIFCGNDNLAFETMTMLKEMGRSVPEDISVIGHDDVDAAALVTPPLTTVRQSLSKIGAMAAALLIKSIDRGHVSPTDHLIAPELVVRGSTGPAPR